MADKRAGEGASTATLDLAWMAAAAVAVVTPVFCLGFGLFWMLRHRPGEDDYGQPATVHPTLGLGFVVLVLGVLIGVLATVVAIAVHSQVAPRLHAARLAAARALDER